jgi:hypothetical protein
MEALDVDIFASESLGISEILVAAFLSPKTGKKLLADACRLSVEVFRYGPLHTLLQGNATSPFVSNCKATSLVLHQLQADRIESRITAWAHFETGYDQEARAIYDQAQGICTQCVRQRQSLRFVQKSLKKLLSDFCGVIVKNTQEVLRSCSFRVGKKS